MFTVGSVASIVYSGCVAPLAFLIAGITTFSAVIPLYIFSTYVSNSGGYFKFVEAATENVYLSKTVGLWYLTTAIGFIIIGAGIVAWFVYSALGILFDVSLQPYALISISLVVPVLYLLVGYFRIVSAAKIAIVISVIQLAFFSSFAIAFVFITPYNGGLYFNIRNSFNDLHGFFLALILGGFFLTGAMGPSFRLEKR